MSVTPLVPTPALVNPLSPWVQGAAVAVGGALGSVLRWRLVVGFMLAVLARYPSETWRLLVITGFLGGMTTFSAFTAESLGLIVKGQLGLALVHSCVHVIGALMAAALGWQIGRWVLA